MNQKKMFRHSFFESFKTLSIPSFLVILLFAVAFAPLKSALYYSNFSYVFSPNYLSVLTMIMPFYCLAMGLIAMRFVTRKKHCEVVFLLGMKRTILYTAIWLSGAVWMAIMSTLYLVYLWLLSISCYPNADPLLNNRIAVFLVFVFIFLLSLFSLVLMACAFVKTKIESLIYSVFFLLLPRSLIYYISFMTRWFQGHEIIGLRGDNDLFRISDFFYNELDTNYLFYTNFNIPWVKMVESLTVGIAAFVIGMIVFKRIKFDQVGKFGKHNVLSLTVAFLTAVLVGLNLCPVYAVIKSNFFQNALVSLPKPLVIVAVTFLIIRVLTMAPKIKWSQVLKELPTVIAIYSVLFMILVPVGFKNINFVPNEEQIESAYISVLDGSGLISKVALKMTADNYEYYKSSNSKYIEEAVSIHKNIIKAEGQESNRPRILVSIIYGMKSGKNVIREFHTTNNWREEIEKIN